MKKIFLFLTITFHFSVAAQPDSHSPYHITVERDLPLVFSGLSAFIAGNIMLNQMDPLSLGELQQLNKNEIPAFDRNAVNRYSNDHNLISDILVTATTIAPTLTFLDKDIRSDFWDILLMGSEVALINNGINILIKSTVERPRPYLYNEDVAVETRIKPYGRLSFYSAHTSNAASLSFFTAKIISGYSEHKLLKKMVWIGAFTFPAVTGYLRYSSGRHFPSDIITGYMMGATIGYLVPFLHQSDSLGEQFQVFINPNQFHIVYRF
ncbi:MAG: phosphatase PAP2 family protein [Candidatus Cyclobacteriaceae bacterium M3_2C_046]